MRGEGAYSFRFRIFGLGIGLILMNVGILAPDSLNQLRTINLKVVADEELKCSCESWCFYLKTIVHAVSSDFEKRFGIRFLAKEVGGWMSDDWRRTSYGLLNDLRSRIDKGKCDIVVGFTAQEPFETPFSGVSSYTQGYIMIRIGGPSGGWIRKSLKHELCHILGAADIAELNSVMDIQQRGHMDRFDEFSSALINQNRGRTFELDRFPISGASLDHAIEICSDRHEKIPWESGVAELLALFYLENKDWNALKRICLEAVESAPASVEAHNLLGLALCNQEEYDVAIQEFQRVLRLEPCHPDAHYNLALAYLRSGRIEDARESIEKALTIMPGSAPALGTKSELQALQSHSGSGKSSGLLTYRESEKSGSKKNILKKEKP